MANPQSVICPEDSWALVAVNVVTGQVHRLITLPDNYFQTYREHGDPPPVGTQEGVVMFRNGSTEFISAVMGIDVYVRAVGRGGSVRVDAP